MSMDPDLRRKLAALTAERSYSDGAMDLGPSGGDVAFAAALQAIDNTMLPRDLIFSVGATGVTLRVSGRRLRALLRVEGDLATPAGVLDQLLTTAQPDTLAAVGDVMRKLTALPGTLTLTRVSAPALGGASDAGVTVSALSDVWAIDLDAKPPTDIERFCLALGTNLRAMAVIKDGAVVTGLGDDSLLSELKSLWAGEVSEFDPTFAAFKPLESKNMIVSRQGLLPGGELACYVKLHKISILAAISVQSMAEIATAWRHV
ncbi:MAG: hypothetical protein ABJL99_14715 [Aliishimia sp.]